MHYCKASQRQDKNIKEYYIFKNVIDSGKVAISSTSTVTLILGM